jgi:hypothetical protein
MANGKRVSEAVGAFASRYYSLTREGKRFSAICATKRERESERERARTKEADNECGLQSISKGVHTAMCINAPHCAV